MRFATWIAINNKREMGQDLTALEQFIFNNEPAGEEDEKLFRRQLSLALDEVATTIHGASSCPSDNTSQTETPGSPRPNSRAATKRSPSRRKA